MNRRGFFRLAAGAAAAIAFDPERALWVPGRRSFSIPSIDIMLPPIWVTGGIWMDADGQEVGYRYMAPTRDQRGGVVFHESIEMWPSVGVDIGGLPGFFGPSPTATWSKPTSSWPASALDELTVRESIARRLSVSPSRLRLA